MHAHAVIRSSATHKLRLSAARLSASGGRDRHTREPSRQNGRVNETGTAVLAAVAGGAGAFLGATLTTIFNFRTQDKSHRREQLRRDADTLGPIREYLQVRVNPERLAINAPVDDQQTEELHRRLLDERDLHISAVQVMAFGHPDAGVRSKAQEFATALFNTGHSAGWVLRDPIREGRLREAADQSHDRAMKLLQELYELTTAYGDK